MKRILYLSRGGYIGGSQRQLHYLVTGIAGSYEPVIICSKDGHFVELLRSCGLHTQVLPLRPWRQFPAGLLRYFDAERLTRFAKEQDVALVHCSDLWMGNYMSRIAAKLGVPSVLHVRTPVAADKVRKYACRKASAIIAISPRIKQDLLGAGIDEDKITVINDGVDIQAFRPDLTVDILKQTFSSDDRLAIGIISRIDPSKRQLDFVRAAGQIIHSSTKNVAFFIIGEVHSHSYFGLIKQFIAENQLEKHVFFTGRREDMPQVLSSLDIIVSMSGGSVMFEAMACGKPVISAGFSSPKTSVHIQNDITGLLVSSKETAELVAALTLLINSPQMRTRLGQNARKWAEANFSYLDMAAKTRQIYQRLIG